MVSKTAMVIRMREECELYNGRPTVRVLAIELDEEFFGLRLMIRDDGFFFDDLGVVETHLLNGTSSNWASETSQAFWSWLGERIEILSKAVEAPLDLLSRQTLLSRAC